MPQPALSRRSVLFHTLAGGLALACIALSGGPANAAETAEMLEIIRGLKARGLTILLIEHKLDLVMQLSDRVVVMDHGARIAEGPPAAVAGDPAVIEAYLGHKAVGAANQDTGQDADAAIPVQIAH